MNKILAVLLLSFTITITSCISPEERAQFAQENRIAVAEIESKMPAMGSAFEKGCLPYLNEEPLENIISQMKEYGYEGYPKRTFQLNIAEEYMALTNPEAGVQIQLQLDSGWANRCVAIIIPTDVTLVAEAKKSLRTASIVSIKEIGEKYAEMRKSKLKKAIGSSDYYIGIQISPQFKFSVPYISETDSTALVGIRYSQDQ